MDCSLSTWPSVTQFDDFVWTGLGDIDALGSLDQTTQNDCFLQLNSPHSTGISQHEGMESASATDTSLCQNDTVDVHNQARQYYPVSSPGSLLVGKWENSVDLEAVLDTSFASECVSCNDEAFDLYTDHMLIQPDGQITDDTDVFIEEPLPEVPDSMIETLSNGSLASDLVAPFPCESTTFTGCQNQMEGVCDVLDGNTTVINDRPFVGDEKQSLKDSIENSRVTYEVTNVDLTQPSSPIIQPQGYYPRSPRKLSGNGDSSISSQSAAPECNVRQTCSQIRTSVHSPTIPQMGLMSGLKTSNGQNLNQIIMPAEDVHSSPVGSNVKLKGATTFGSETKVNKAEVSRARRLAASQRRAEGRAKKYPLQKLIRMSSATTCTRGRLGNDSSPSWSSQAHLPGSVRSIPSGTEQVQQSILTPVVLQPPKVVKGFPMYSSQPPSSSLTAVEDKSSVVVHHPASSQHLPSTVHNIQNSVDSRDAILLDQLQNVLRKMSKEMRFCMRDGFYRLAKSANQRQGNHVNATNSGASSKGFVELPTNSIDRWIVNLLYANESELPNAAARSLSTTVLTPAPCTDPSWGSCGSFLNLQDKPCHAMTGS